jgi:hypothetical protein
MTPVIPCAGLIRSNNKVGEYEMIRTKTKAVIVVDEDNNWLSFNLGHNVKEAIRLAKQASEYTKEAHLIAYKVIEEVDMGS